VKAEVDEANAERQSREGTGGRGGAPPQSKECESGKSMKPMPSGKAAKAQVAADGGRQNRCESGKSMANAERQSREGTGRGGGAPRQSKER
jgi:hypothetical protein